MYKKLKDRKPHRSRFQTEVHYVYWKQAEELYCLNCAYQLTMSIFCPEVCAALVEFIWAILAYPADLRRLSECPMLCDTQWTSFSCKFSPFLRLESQNSAYWRESFNIVLNYSLSTKDEGMFLQVFYEELMMHPYKVRFTSASTSSSQEHSARTIVSCTQGCARATTMENRLLLPCLKHKS